MKTGGIRVPAGRPTLGRVIAARSVLGIGLQLWAFLTFLRGFIIPIEQADFTRLPGAYGKVIAAGYLDFLFVAMAASLAICLTQLLSRWRAAVITVFVAYCFIAGCTVLVGITNIQTVRMLGGPFTFAWLQYSDFLQGADALNALDYSATPRLLAAILAGVVYVLAGGVLAGRFVGSLARSLPPRPLLAFMAALTLCYVAGAGWYVEVAGWKRGLIVNPIAAFAQSAPIFQRAPLLLTMPTSVSTRDFDIVADRPSGPPKQASAGGAIKNVLIYIMESVPSEYVETYGGGYLVTPTLTRLRARTMQFEAIYAHAPATNYSIVSLLTSTYPRLSDQSITSDVPQIGLQTISEELKRRGYRTGFFSSADNRFQSLDAFLSTRLFDIVQDYRGRACDRPPFEISGTKWKFLDFSTDACTAEAANKWIGSKDAPFMAVVMTAMTHYPYPSLGNQIHFVDDEALNRYLNALRAGDDALGEIYAHLERTGQADNTLLVVLGDHGEAFGRHGDFVHASAIYEENVHIPLLFINGRLFGKERSRVVGGLVDIAPTIFDLLGAPLAPMWQGYSLFDPDRPKRTFFFSPWGGLSFGFREDDFKVIYNLIDGKSELYDLSADPEESVNLAPLQSHLVKNDMQYLAAWMKFQSSLYRRVPVRKQ